MGQKKPQVAGIQNLYPGLVRECIQLSPCNWDQRVLVLLGGVHFPVCHQEEEFRLVGKVQLHHERGVGRGNWTRYHSHVPCLCCEHFTTFFIGYR